MTQREVSSREFLDRRAEALFGSMFRKTSG